ncbi:DNA translocase FtsK [Rubripirellula obstinata]|uniref:DNA translocase FtsK n=1 Tax=Rubripirellula obstinata TaxID=406547 RepID=A0A5B1CPJ7_9BACT|nr:DNA translocase FtsK [Rubripirellula obstinata]KAA1262181.1 DNA translocase FtsK [Rubripirellula obstinata]
MSAASIESHDDQPIREPNLARDITAIALFAITLIVTVSVVTRSAADPLDTPVWPISNFYQPDTVIYPTNPAITNACGYWGAMISSILLDCVGLATALVIAAMGGTATALITRGTMNAPVLRSFGGTVVVLAAATGAGLLPTQLDGMPVVGNGGYLGAMSSTWLLEHFAPAGAWILTLTTLTIGLLLTTDYALLYAGRAIMSRGARATGSVRRAGKFIPLAGRTRQPFTDLEQPITIDGDQAESDDADFEGDEEGDESELEIKERHEPTIKFNRPKKTATAAIGAAAAAGLAAAATAMGSSPSDQDEEEYEEEEDYWDEDEEGEDTEVAESPTREIEVEDETVTLRQDEPHPVSHPKVRAPKPKTKKDPRQEFYDSINVNAPEGSEDYQLPNLQLLEQSDDISYEDQLVEVRRKALILEETFKNFGFNIRVVEIETGPVIAQYEIELEAGLRLSKITGLADDLAIALRVPSVRIVSPIPGKNTVGIEVPNENRQVVMLRDVIEESDTRAAKMNIPVFLGKDVSGNPMVVDLAKMPHLLIAGRTGTGKSVCLNAIITSILMCCRPNEVRMLMIDPKMVELSGYGQLPHLMHPVIVDMKKAEAILAWAVEKMEERYGLLARAGVRHINSFNALGREEVLRRLEIDEADEAKDIPDKLPFIVIIADEMADLMMTAGKDVETHIVRIAQKARAVGIHLILATQKPTVDVITGLIKSNLPARLSFQVASKTDSRVVLDENGADKLLGNGDMLFLWPGTSTTIRGQGTYLSDEEIDAVCAHCSMGKQNFVGELMNLKVDEEGSGETASLDELKKKDELYDSAIEVVIREGRGSCSLLQRCLGIGYGRAAKLIDFMAEDGIVGAYNGSKAREVILTMPQWNAMQGIEDEEEEVDDEEEYEEEELVEEEEYEEEEEEPGEELEDEYEYEDAEDEEEYEDV